MIKKLFVKVVDRKYNSESNKLLKKVLHTTQLRYFEYAQQPCTHGMLVEPFLTSS